MVFYGFQKGGGVLTKRERGVGAFAFPPGGALSLPALLVVGVEFLDSTMCLFFLEK